MTSCLGSFKMARFLGGGRLPVSISRESANFSHGRYLRIPESSSLKASKRMHRPLVSKAATPNLFRIAASRQESTRRFLIKNSFSVSLSVRLFREDKMKCLGTKRFKERRWRYTYLSSGQPLIDLIFLDQKRYRSSSISSLSSNFIVTSDKHYRVDGTAQTSSSPSSPSSIGGQQLSRGDTGHRPSYLPVDCWGDRSASG